MGAFKGTISYAKFHVQGELPENFHGPFVRRIKNRVFEPLSPDDDTPIRWGWCSVLDPFDLELEHEKIYFNSYLNLALRIDRWVIPGPLLKAHLAQAERALLEKKGKERLARREREELKTTVTRKLRKQLLPAMKVIDLSWNLDNGIVRYWARSKRAIELLHEMFEKTFGLKLMAHGPYAVALANELSEKDMQRFEALEPVAFHAVTE